MARPTTAPRLDKLDPIEVGNEVTRLVLEHLHTLGFHVGAEVRQTSPSSVGFSAALLADWAKRGTNGEEWHESMAWDAIRQICEVIYSQAGLPDTFGGGAIQPVTDAIDYEPVDQIDVVLLAAWARVLIAERRLVPVRALAALASMSTQALKNLGTGGEIAIVEGEVRAVAARSWLGERGMHLL